MFSVVSSMVLNRKQHVSLLTFSVQCGEEVQAGAPLQVPSLSRMQLCYHICRGDLSAPGEFHECFENTSQTDHLIYFSRNICLLDPEIDLGRHQIIQFILTWKILIILRRMQRILRKGMKSECVLVWESDLNT